MSMGDLNDHVYYLEEQLQQRKREAKQLQTLLLLAIKAIPKDVKIHRALRDYKKRYEEELKYKQQAETLRKRREKDKRAALRKLTEREIELLDLADAAFDEEEEDE